MQESLKLLIVRLLKDTAEKINSGNCELTEEEASDILSVLSHKVLSKEEAIAHVNVQRSRFDDLVRLGCLPKGRKRRGFKELVWYEDEINDAIKRNKEKYNINIGNKDMAN